MVTRNCICRICGIPYHDCGSCGNPSYMSRGFCEYRCYKQHEDKVVLDVLEKHGVSLKTLHRILGDLFDNDVNIDFWDI